jgi:hypothetical protein
MTEIIDFEGRRGEREKVKLEREQEKSFSEIESDFDREVTALSLKGCDCIAWGARAMDEYMDWYDRLSNKQQAKILLDQAAKVHDLAKRLLDAAIREEPKKAS